MSKSEWSQLHLAVESNNLPRIKELIQNGVNVNEITRLYKNTVLHVCANEGHIDIMCHAHEITATRGHEKAKNLMKELLIVCSTLLNKKNRNSDTALHIAVKRVHTDVTELLLRYGIDINTTNSEGNTALHIAIISLTQIADYEVEKKQKLNLIIKILISGRASIRILNKSGMTSLALAAKNNLLDAAKIIVNGRPGSMNRRCIDRKTALYFAASERHVGMIKLLMEAGAKINVRVKNDILTTPLHAAAIVDRENTDIIHSKLYKVFKEKVYARNNQDDTALMLAVQHGLVNSTEFLVLCGSNIVDRRNDGMTPLKFAAQMKDTNLLTALNTYGDLLDKAIQENDSMIVEALVECGFNFNGDHLFMAICKKVDDYSEREENLKIIRFLIRKIPHVNKLHRNGSSVFEYAILCMKEELCDDLLAVGCAGSISSIIISPDYAQKFLEGGHDVNSLNPLGEIPLFLAAHRKNAELLLKGGNNLYQRNDAGETILHSAVRNLDSNTDINEYLIFCLKHCSQLLDVFSKARVRCTPLYIAIILKRYNMAAELIRHGANCSLGRLDPDISCVMLAQEQSNPYLLRLMIRAGVSLPQSVPVVQPLVQQCILFVRHWLKHLPGGIFNNLEGIQKNMGNMYLPDMVIDMIMLRLRFRYKVTSAK